MKRFAVLLALIISGFLPYAMHAEADFPVSDLRRKTVTGKVLDSLSKDPVPGAVVELLTEGTDSVMNYTLTGTEGNFSTGYSDQYTFIRISIIGYKTKVIKIPEGSDRKESVDNIKDIGDILLQEDRIVLSSSSISEQAIRSSQNGDTLSYSAAAYRVMSGSDSEALISKMPGIAVSESGVEANGKDVRKIMIDGQEFFGDDVITALKNIPADMIRQIQVVNKLSDQAELTGVDDGYGYTAINIVTKDEARNGALSGKLYGGYGLPDKYIAGGNLNWFGKEHSVSVLGMGNNISKYNFSSGSIVGGSTSDNSGSGDFKVKALPGISSVQSSGVNYSNKWFTGSYFFSRVDNENLSTIDKENLLGDNKIQKTGTESDFSAINLNHRFSAKISFSPKERHSIIIRPLINFQEINDSRIQKSSQANIYDDGISKFIRDRLNDNRNSRMYIKAGGSASYRYMFPKKGRSIALSSSYYYNRNGSEEYAEQFNFNMEDSGFDTENASSASGQRRDRLTRQTTAYSGITFTEPIGRKSRLSIEYKFGFNGSKGDNYTWLKDIDSGLYSDVHDTRQSAVNSSRFTTNAALARYNYGFRKISVTISGGWQNTGFYGVSVIPYENETSRHFNNFIYSAVINVPVNRKHSVRIDARGRTVNPSVTMLQNVVNLSNTSNIRAGNPDIEPSYLNEAGVRYIYTGSEKGSTFSFSLNYTGSGSYLCDSLVIDSPDFEVTDGVLLGEGNQFTKPINLGGYSKIESRMTYGLPVSFLMSNLNINAAVSASRLPGMINGDYVPVHRNWYSLGARIDSNISEFIDFTASYTGRYTENEYSGKFGKVSNNYISHFVSGQFKWIFFKGFTVSLSGRFRQDRSIDGNFNDRILLCDFYLGKRLLRNGMGEVNIGVNDIFNDSIRQFGHSINASGSTDAVNTGLGRYFSIQFIYHLRNYM